MRAGLTADSRKSCERPTEGTRERAAHGSRPARITPSGVPTIANKEIEFVGCDCDAFMGFGQTSGDVWMVGSERSQWNARKTTKDESETFHQNYKFFLINDMGEELVVQGSRNWVYHKDGNLVMENLNTRKCPQIW